MKVRKIGDAVLSVNGKLYCAFCGTEISSIENGCSCNKWASMTRDLGLIATAQGQIDKYQRIADEQKKHYEETIATLYGRMPETKLQVVTVEKVTEIPDEPSEEEGEVDSGGGSGEEPTEGGGE